jgi:hypothetical protein
VGGARRPPQHPEPRTRAPLLDRAAGTPHEGYRRLEGKLDPETASRLKATLSSLEPEALYAALRAEMELFRGLRATAFGRATGWASIRRRRRRWKPRWAVAGPRGEGVRGAPKPQL